jgi:hypothetical protein
MYSVTKARKSPNGYPIAKQRTVGIATKGLLSSCADTIVVCVARYFVALAPKRPT